MNRHREAARRNTASSPRAGGRTEPAQPRRTPGAGAKVLLMLAALCQAGWLVVLLVLAIIG